MDLNEKKNHLSEKFVWQKIQEEYHQRSEPKGIAKDENQIINRQILTESFQPATKQVITTFVKIGELHIHGGITINR